MKFLTILVIALAVLSASAFKKHNLAYKYRHQLQMVKDVLSERHAVEVEECKGVDFLKCVQNNLTSDENETIAEQVVQLISAAQSNPDDQQAVIQQIQGLTQDETVGPFWICAFGAVGGIGETCQGEQGGDDEEEIAFLSLVNFNVKSFHGKKRLPHEKLVDRVRRTFHKQAQENQEAVKCMIVNVLSAIENLDPEDNEELVKQVMDLQAENSEADEEVEEPSEELEQKSVLELICNETTGDFWKEVIEGAGTCSGVQVDLSSVQCPE